MLVDFKDLAWKRSGEKGFTGEGKFGWESEILLEEKEDPTNWILDLEDLLQRPLAIGDKPILRKVVRYLENEDQGYGLGIEIRVGLASSGDDKLPGICTAQ